MNYLAHVFLSRDNSELMIGSLLGDFVKGSINGSYPPEVRKGIELHRKIDSYTDSHRIFCASKNIVSPQRRRFAGIMVDLFYDHFLARYWSEYSTTPLNEFSGQVYRALIEGRDILPDALKRVLPFMIEQDWLASYKEIGNIDRALNRISTRLKHSNTLFNSAEELEEKYSLFDRDFHTFFPDLIDFVDAYKKQ